jgi:hypothetical protein
VPAAAGGVEGSPALEVTSTTVDRGNVTGRGQIDPGSYGQGARPGAGFDGRPGATGPGRRMVAALGTNHYILKIWIFLKLIEFFWIFFKKCEFSENALKLRFWRSEPAVSDQLYSSGSSNHGLGIFLWKEHAHVTFPDDFIIE